MDRKIDKGRWTKKRLLYISMIIVVLVLSVFGFRSLNKKVYKLDRNKITVKEVKSGDFQDIILIDAVVEPIASVLVNTSEGGMVEEVEFAFLFGTLFLLNFWFCPKLAIRKLLP